MKHLFSLGPSLGHFRDDQFPFLRDSNLFVTTLVHESRILPLLICCFPDENTLAALPKTDGGGAVPGLEGLPTGLVIIHVCIAPTSLYLHSTIYKHKIS